MTKPSFGKLWENYPTENQEALFKTVLGAGWPELIGKPAYDNTCAVRMSVTLNRSGLLINATAGAADGGHRDKHDNHILVRVDAMRDFLQSIWGKPDWGMSHKPGSSTDTSFLPKLKGVLLYRAEFQNARGHVDLWDGARFRGSNQFNDVNHAYEYMLWFL